MDSDEERQMTHYLLGQLAEHEEAEIERRYLADDTLFEELLAIEDDLHDAYSRDELSGPDREAFEHRLLTLPRQKDKQELVETFHRHVLRAASPARRASKLELLLGFVRAQRKVFLPVFSAAVAILIVGVWWVGHRGVRPGTSNSVPGQGAETQGQKPSPSPESPGATFAVTLVPGLARGGEGSEAVVIPAETSRVRFEARFEGQYPSYRALLETVEGRQVWSEGNLQAETFPGGLRIFLDVSSSLLSPGDYILSVQGVPATGRPQTVADYTFRVAKR